MRIFIISLLYCSAAVSAGDWTNYTTANSGLAGNHVRAVIVDPQGNKWFGTDQGLSAYDGVKWLTYIHDDNQQTLADNSINDLAFETSSYGPELWIATDNGVSVMAIPSIDAVTKATPYRTDNTGLIDNKVTAAAVDPLRHERWFGTPNGVSRFSSSGWRNFSMSTVPILAWNDVTDIGIDVAGGWKYICTQNGIQEMNGVSRLRTKLDDVDAITSPSPYNVEWSGLYSSMVYSVFVDTDGTQWFGTAEGFAYHDTLETKAGWDQFTTAEGLINNVVTSLIKGSDQVVWVGTLGGLARFEYQLGEFGVESYKFTHYTTADGLVNNEVTDITFDLDGTLWIATANGVSHFSGVTAGVLSESDLHPREYFLNNNYPNPFNAGTTIRYATAAFGHVELTISNMYGQIVRGLVSAQQNSGDHAVSWDGRFSNGEAAPTGVYIVNLKVVAEGNLFSDSKKIVLVK
ncbi:MAG: T9SS C-terminal target domain-containing protein [Calditrichaeota bacterium]|nr:MAG: T9SS C-terminal target domain-containing protein [Calditrichota bacterium]